MPQSRRSFLCRSAVASAGLLARALGARESGHRPRGIDEERGQTQGREDVIFLTPEEGGYAVAREVHNAGLTLRPKRIALCATEAGVQHALQRATQEHWPVAVKAGGHSFEGFCLNENGLVINVSPLSHLRLDAKTGFLTAGAGCRLREVNRFLLPHGRYLPAGSCGTVGLAGLTLGGGYGMFARKWGLTCDHLHSLRMVSGDGAVRTSDKEPDLLWAARGGGNGHFGIVTELTLQTRRLPKAFASWKFRTYHLTQALSAKLLAAWFEATAALPNDAFSAWIMNGTQLTVLLTTIGSPEEKGVQAFRRRLAALSGKTTSAAPVPLSRALPWYYGEPGPVAFKNASAGYYRSIADLEGALTGVFKEVLTNPGIVFQINTMGGAIMDGPEGAYPHREWGYLGEAQAYWENPGRAADLQEAIGRIREHLAQAGIHRHYANYPDLAFENWSEAYYGQKNYERLQQLKVRYDPANHIRHPQSVRLPG